MRAPSPGVVAFAEEVGDEGAVTVVGGRTQWMVGGAIDGDATEVRAPVGVVAFDPAEMTARVGAGTPVDHLKQTLAEAGQTVALPDRHQATVGGVLAVGQTDVRRLGRGPVRDTLLEVTGVAGDGGIVRAGGPTVKNVSGFDLCRLFVGSLGTLFFVAEVVLRTRPLPQVAQWFAGETDPFELRRRLYRPAALLWDGARTWCLLEGHAVDVADEADLLTRLGLVEVDGGPPLPPHRHSVAPDRVADETGGFVAEVGVGVVHREAPRPPAVPPPEVQDLHRRLKARFDPTDRLNPGRSPLR